VVTAVKNAKAGQVKFRNDKGGIVHATIGKVNFEIPALRENLNTLLADLLRLKPASAKGQYLLKISLSTTMGLGVTVDPSTVQTR
jgi:large subunit ribosomal protein L1